MRVSRVPSMYMPQARARRAMWRGGLCHCHTWAVIKLVLGFCFCFCFFNASEMASEFELVFI